MKKTKALCTCRHSLQRDYMSNYKISPNLLGVKHEDITLQVEQQTKLLLPLLDQFHILLLVALGISDKIGKTNPLVFLPLITFNNKSRSTTSFLTDQLRVAHGIMGCSIMNKRAHFLQRWMCQNFYACPQPHWLVGTLDQEAS